MERIEKSIEVNVPLRTAYNQWTQFEEFPQFMDGVERVTQMDDTRLHWVAEIGGRHKEWDAKITQQIPDSCISWTSEAGTFNAGTASFAPIDENRTRLTLRIDYNPEDAIEGVADKLGFLDRRVDGDLHRFKEFIESRGVETGGWRGSVSGGMPRGGTGGTPTI